MKRVVLAIAAAACLYAAPAIAEWGSPCETRATILDDLSQIRAIARCSWQTAGVQDNSVKINGSHTLNPGNLFTACGAYGYCGTSLTLQPFAASTTYTSSATFKASQAGLVFRTITVDHVVTTAPPERPRESDPLDPLRPPVPCMEPGCSPIIIGLDHANYELTGADDPVRFDLDADGVSERLAWTARGSAQAFLALDRNGNGAIDDGRELFGTYTPLASGRNASNGFVALAELDDDADGIIDSGDDVWARLLLWIDANHDGTSQPNELQHMDGSRVVSLSTTHSWSGRRDQHGNTFRYRGEVVLRLPNGATVPQPVYDVFFVAAF